MNMHATNRPWTLASLLEGWCGIEHAQDVVVGGLALDSRRVEAGDVFCAVQGVRTHGLEHVGDALARGAVAVLSDRATDMAIDVPLIVLPGLAAELGPIAARFHGDPSRRMTVIGVTGTDGKTSVSHFIAQALDLDSAGAALVGTLGYGLVGRLKSHGHTTPDALSLQAALAEVARDGARWVVMEASSHGLEQGRLNGVAFDQAVLTQLARDHLDYHGTLEAYAAAKRRLFAWPGLDYAILNLDDDFGRGLATDLEPMPHLLGYTLQDRDLPGVEVVAGRDLRLMPHGLSMLVATPWGEARVESALYGRFNAANLLAALTSLLGLGASLPDAVERLRHVCAVPGRMERFHAEGRPVAVVDYAHTPGALEAALRALREHGASRVHCVFGAGGDRDRGKRPLMGAAAERHADVLIITDDNPRSEDPAAIVNDIRTGLHAPDAARVVHDRAQAIRQALEGAAAGDVVLIAGKGHETDQVGAAGARHHSDRETVRVWFEEVSA
jgi:UDP-N-acetylmuramoyl-L-alanyl-D-glutamate--2,6-diaminopimelate ligase